MTDSIKKNAGFVNKFLKKELKGNPKQLYDAASHLILHGGKRLRPFLVLKSCQMLGGKQSDAIAAASAVEMIHNFTLVHDDIMDDDLLRHGQPTVQNKWDNATAILAGDGLFVEAHRAISKVRNNTQRVGAVFNDGALAVCVGQAYDKEYEENQTITLNDYLHMTEKKTGAMLSLCMEIPALLANQDDGVCSQLRNFGYDIGKGFQIHYYLIM